MTDLAAIRARDAADLTIAWDLTGAAWREAFRIVAQDRRDLLAEVDRLRALIWEQEAWSSTGKLLERARIRAAVKGLPAGNMVGANAPTTFGSAGEFVSRAAVLAAIDGETT